MRKRLNRIRIRYSSFHGSSWRVKEIYQEYFLEVLPYRIRIEVTDHCE